MIVLISLLGLFLVNAEIPATLSYMVGTVHIERDGKLYSGVINATLNINDVVTTKDESECEVQFSDYSLVRLEPNSSIRIERKEQTETGVFHRIFAAVGEIVTKVTKMNKGDEYEVRTDAAQAFIRGTTFKTNVEEDGASSFSVFEGSITAKSILEGATEVVLDQYSKSQFIMGELAPVLDKLTEIEITEFTNRFQDFLDRAKALEQLREKLEEEQKEKEEEIKKKIDETEDKLKGIFK